MRGAGICAQSYPCRFLQMTQQQRIAALDISEFDFYHRVAIICRDANVTCLRAEQYIFDELSYNKEMENV